MTVTHPHHPLRGQQLPVVGFRHGEHPDVIVRLSDGSHAAIAIDATEPSTDSPAPIPPADVAHMLDLDGLRRMAQLLDVIRRRGCLPDSSS